MDYLIIYAHPNPKSFNHAILEQVESELIKRKKTYEIRDLNALHFNPVLDGKDFTAMSRGIYLDDVKTEQDFILKSKTLIFIYPIWWFGMPSILKGYIDRIFSHGFAFRFTDKGPEGLLKGKKVIIFNTTGGPQENYQAAGFLSALKTTTEIGIFEFCGMKVIEHPYFFAVPYVPEEARKKMLEGIQEKETLILWK
jgi:NAD(P)H dehydrogenase (quinone)